MRLIDADALMETMRQERERIAATYGENDEYVRCLEKYAMSMVENAKTVDAVPVVRCRDCKWWNHDDLFCNFWEGVRIPQAYCSHGERREGDGDGGGA